MKLTPEQLLASFLEVGAENKAKVADDRYVYVEAKNVEFIKAKLLPEKEDQAAKNVVRIDVVISGAEKVYYTNSFELDYFAKFTRGTLINVTAKRWYAEDGTPTYDGRTTLWTIEEISVAAVKASAPLTM